MFGVLCVCVWCSVRVSLDLNFYGQVVSICMLPVCWRHSLLLINCPYSLQYSIPDMHLVVLMLPQTVWIVPIPWLRPSNSPHGLMLTLCCLSCDLFPCLLLIDWLYIVSEGPMLQRANSIPATEYLFLMCCITLPVCCVLSAEVNGAFSSHSFL